MRLLPLVLSAHPSCWHVEPEMGGRQERNEPVALSPCRFCGWPAAGWHEPFHLNGDHADDSSANVVAACVLCHLTQHLDRLRIAEEATLIWLPELSQAAVIALTRRIHLVLVAHGEPPHMGRRPRRDDPPLVAVFSAYKALLACEAALAGRLGTTRPAELGAALLSLRPAAYARRTDLLGGIRLLPLGRLFRDGEDIYPNLLASVAETPLPLH